MYIYIYVYVRYYTNSISHKTNLPRLVLVNKLKLNNRTRARIRSERSGQYICPSPSRDE